MISSVFISKDLNEVEPLKEKLEIDEIKLHASSLIKFKPVEFNIDKDFDVVFFSSSRAVYYFLSHVHVSKLKDKKIACSGNKTAEFIKKYKLKIDFIPSQPGNISQSKNEFHDWLENKGVLFPCSNLSLKSFIKGLPGYQYNVVNIYQTIYNSIEINNCDAYVFSSPSNVISFFQKNNLNASALIISWGESTSKCLIKYGFKSNYTLKYGDLNELLSIFDKIND